MLPIQGRDSITKSLPDQAVEVFLSAASKPEQPSQQVRFMAQHRLIDLRPLAHQTLASTTRTALFLCNCISREVLWSVCQSTCKVLQMANLLSPQMRVLIDGHTACHHAEAEQYQTLVHPCKGWWRFAGLGRGVQHLTQPRPAAQAAAVL